jgi:hypothetical protein
MSPSFDSLNPELMAELHRARAPFMPAYDRLWRDERLLRFVYWLKHGIEPSFNLIGSWNDTDVLEETAMWTWVYAQGLDNEEAIALNRLRLEERFEMSLDEARRSGSDLSLASAGLPIWNDLTGSLLPQLLGRTRLSFATDFQPEACGQNIGYSYRIPDASVKLDLFIYQAEVADLGTGLSHPRVHEQFQSEMRLMQDQWHRRGVKDESDLMPNIEAIVDAYDRRTEFLSVARCLPNDQGGVWTSMRLTAMCGAFLKIRCTVVSERDASEVMKECDVDLGRYCAHFEIKC